MTPQDRTTHQDEEEVVALNNPAMLLRSTCSNCNLRESCLPTGLPLKEIERLEELVTGNRRRINRGESLFRAGDRFDTLYAVRLGFLKSTVMSSDGREQVTNFFMAGEMIGFDGISSGVHSCESPRLKIRKSASSITTSLKKLRPPCAPWVLMCLRCSRAKSCVSTA